MKEKLYAIWLATALGAGSPYAKCLIEAFDSFEAIYGCSESDYTRVGLSGVSLKKLMQKDLAESRRYYDFCSGNYFGMIEYTDPQYPARLKTIQDPPPLLFCRGRMIDFDDNVCIGVVGTRSYTDNGWNAVYRVTHELASDGAVIVSGLASGIDTAATRAALDATGFAVGFVGSGVERIYPSENKDLFEEMYKKGLVLSELPPFYSIYGSNFPVRNRLISGVCQGVLVGEGDVRSGSMITARHACEQGRRIYAIPGDVNAPESSGVNTLIREGATPVFGASDILKDYVYLYPHRIRGVEEETVPADIPEQRSSKRVRFVGTTGGKTSTQSTPKPERPKTEKPKETAQAKEEPPQETSAAEPSFAELMTEVEKKVYAKLGAEPALPDALAGDGISPDEVLAALTMLEIYGAAEKIGGGFVKK